MSWKDALGYWIGQVIGAVIAGAILLLLTKVVSAPDLTGGLGTNAVANAGGAGGANPAGGAMGAGAPNPAGGVPKAGGAIGASTGIPGAPGS